MVYYRINCIKNDNKYLINWQSEEKLESLKKCINKSNINKLLLLVRRKR